MFHTDELVVYGSSGVCRVVDVGTPHIGGVDKSRQYYTLQPLYSGTGLIYSPTDSTKVTMRCVMDADMAKELISHLQDIKPLPVDNTKHLEADCKDAIKSCNAEACMRIIKTLYIRKLMRKAAGRKATAVDDRYLRNAEDHLFGELAVALARPREEIEKKVLSKIEAMRG